MPELMNILTTLDEKIGELQKALDVTGKALGKEVQDHDRTRNLLRDMRDMRVAYDVLRERLHRVFPTAPSVFSEHHYAAPSCMQPNFHTWDIRVAPLQYRFTVSADLFKSGIGAKEWAKAATRQAIAELTAKWHQEVEKQLLRQAGLENTP